MEISMRMKFLAAEAALCLSFLGCDRPQAPVKVPADNGAGLSSCLNAVTLHPGSDWRVEGNPDIVTEYRSFRGNTSTTLYDLEKGFSHMVGSDTGPPLSSNERRQIQSCVRSFSTQGPEQK
jgi:hypothetical protein